MTTQTPPAKTELSKADDVERLAPLDDDEEEDDEPDSVSYVEFKELLPELAQAVAPVVAEAVVAALLPLLSGEEGTGVTKSLRVPQRDEAGLLTEAHRLMRKALDIQNTRGVRVPGMDFGFCSAVEHGSVTQAMVDDLRDGLAHIA